MKRLIRRWKRWNAWRKVCHYGKVKKMLIFFGIIHCGWFEMFPY